MKSRKYRIKRLYKILGHKLFNKLNTTQREFMINTSGVIELPWIGIKYTDKDVEKLITRAENPEAIGHSIDVRYEPDVIKAFNKFIEKWCGGWYPHLIDTDEQDGQFMREKIEELVRKSDFKTMNELIDYIKERLELWKTPSSDG